jgi:hypothetical protein
MIFGNTEDSTVLRLGLGMRTFLATVDGIPGLLPHDIYFALTIRNSNGARTNHQDLSGAVVGIDDHRSLLIFSIAYALKTKVTSYFLTFPVSKSCGDMGWDSVAVKVPAVDHG